MDKRLNVAQLVLVGGLLVGCSDMDRPPHVAGANTPPPRPSTDMGVSSSVAVDAASVVDAAFDGGTACAPQVPTPIANNFSRTIAIDAQNVFGFSIASAAPGIIRVSKD